MQNQKQFSKIILREGTYEPFFDIGSKVYIHFQARLCDEENTVLDDTKQIRSPPEPFEVIIGKYFRLPIWEDFVKSMKMKEIAQFKVDKSLVLGYAYISKILRDTYTERKRPPISMLAVPTLGYGYEDLDNFVKNPIDMEFIIELIHVQDWNDYDYSWKMTRAERIARLPSLKSLGDESFKKENLRHADASYSEALDVLEDLLLLEQPSLEEMKNIKSYKIPILLNLALVKLLERNYYHSICFCTDVLLAEPDNIKALFRRAKCNIKTWNFDTAKADIKKILDLDPSFSTFIKEEMIQIEELHTDRKHNRSNNFLYEID